MNALVGENWISRLRTRLHWAIAAFRADPKSPVISLGNGVLWDLSTNVVTVEGDFHLHTTGKMSFTSDSHIILSSGSNLGGTGNILLNCTTENPEPELIMIHTHEHEGEEELKHQHECGCKPDCQCGS